MKRKIIKPLVILFIIISVIFIGTGVYIAFNILGSSFLNNTAKSLIIILLTFSLSYGALSFIIMALILRESYKIIKKRK